MRYEPQVQREIRPRHSLFISPALAESLEVWKEPTYRPFLGTVSSRSGTGESDSNTLDPVFSPPYLDIPRPRTLAQSLTFQARRLGVGFHTLVDEFRTLETSVSTAHKSEYSEDVLRRFIKVRARTAFEEADMYQDRCPGLEIRKALLRSYAGIRQMSGVIAQNSLFQTFIIIMILVNTILLALEDPSLDIQPEPYRSMERILLYIYTFEMGLKVIAMGLVWGRNSYLRDPWNVLDFIVVVTGWLEQEYTSSGINLSGLRALRILRPLRSITRIQGMKIVFLSLMGSAKMLLSSIMLLVFFYLIASIAFLQMFMGALRYKCMHLDTGIISTTLPLCGSVSCPSSYTCVSSLDNPNHGKTHFDNLFMSMLMIYQSVTLEGWNTIMSDLERTVGRFIVAIYIPIVFLGAFFFMNMTLIAMKSSVSFT